MFSWYSLMTCPTITNPILRYWQMIINWIVMLQELRKYYNEIWFDCKTRKRSKAWLLPINEAECKVIHIRLNKPNEPNQLNRTDLSRTVIVLWVIVTWVIVTSDIRWLNYNITLTGTKLDEPLKYYITKWCWLYTNHK